MRIESNRKPGVSLCVQSYIEEYWTNNKALHVGAMCDHLTVLSRSLGTASPFKADVTHECCTQPNHQKITGMAKQNFSRGIVWPCS